MQLKIPGLLGVELVSVVKCPHCRSREMLRMPSYAVKWLYECPQCKKEVRTEDGKCCIFCSYGTVPCPDAQEKKLQQRIEQS